MSSILEQVFEVYESNRKMTLDKFEYDFDKMEKQSRCLFFIGESIQNREQKIGEQLNTIFKEVFLDLSQSIYLVAQSQYRTAYQSLRSALELTTAGIFFADHPIEFIKWQNDKFDFQFSLIKEVLSTDYALALGINVVPNLEEVRELYRTLSQYVHGKFEYLTAESKTILRFEKSQVDRFIVTFNKTFKSLINLCLYRFEQSVQNAIESYPFLSNYTNQ